MDRDAANREISRLIDHYRSLPYSQLLAVADGDAIESQINSMGELITLSVGIRRSSNNSVRINVSAFGNNWWKHERIDESVLVKATPDTD